MAVTESLATKLGTHPSFASSMTRIECDQCGKTFQADCCIDGVWKFHNDDAGMTEYGSGEAEELCQSCAEQLMV
jgi:hypothetical protein